jgi:hypothetical protein
MGLFDGINWDKLNAPGGASDMLTSLGMGLLSNRNLGQGIGQGFQNYQQQALLGNQQKRQASLDKLAADREARMAAGQDWLRQHTVARDAVTDQHSAQTMGLQQAQFDLQKQQANKPQLVDVPQADGTVQKQWVTPGGAVGGASGAPGVAVGAAVGDGDVERDVAARKRVLQTQGVDASDPRNQQYMLTGKFPREDAQPLTASDKKAILDADEMVLANETAINNLGRAKGLSKEAWGFPGAGMLAKPASLFSEGAQKTVEMDNTVIQQALDSLKSTFGGNPTEGERAILLQLQGSSSQPDAVRQKIFSRAEELVKKRLEFNKQRAGELRGGSYFKPKDAAAPLPPAPSVTTFPTWSIEK